MRQFLVGLSGLIAVLIIVGFGFGATSVSAQPAKEKWSPLGPDEVHVNCITVDPVDHKTVYAGTRTAVFKSTDGGQTWVNTNKGLPNLDIYSITVDPVNNKNVYLTSPYYLVKSVDGGQNWFYLHPKINPVNGWDMVIPSELIIDPVESNTIFTPTSLGLMRTVDGGNNWEVMSTGKRDDEGIVSLIFDATNHKIVYSGLRKYTGVSLLIDPKGFQDRVIQSLDSGVTWHEIMNTSIAILGLNTQINAAGLFSDPSVLGLTGLFVGDCDVYNLCQNIECFLARGTGAIQFCQSQKSGPRPDQLLASPGDHSRSFSYYSNLAYGIEDPDFLPVFNNNPFPFTYLNYLAVDPHDLNVLYAKTKTQYQVETLYKSTDGAVTWVSIGNGFNSRTINALAADPANPGTVLAGGNQELINMGPNGLSRKTSSDSTFKPIIDPVINSSNLTAITFNQHNPNIVLAFANGIIYRSTDGGLSWNIAKNFFDSSTMPYALSFGRIVFESPASDIVYVSISGPNQAQQLGIMKSVDGGLNWSPTNNGLSGLFTMGLVSDPRNPGTLFTSVQGDTGGLFRTTNGGANWQRIGAQDFSCSVDFIAIDPWHPSTVYLSSCSLYKSIDNGETWTRLINPFGNYRYNLLHQSVSSFVFDPWHPGTMYASTNNYPGRIMVAIGREELFKGVLKSTNGGLSWWPANDGLLTPLVTSLAFDSNGKLYAGTDGGSVFVTDTAVSARAGDVNGDGKVDVRDLITMANGLAGNLQLDPFSADVLADGQINVQDLFALCQFLAGNVTTLPIAPSQ